MHATCTRWEANQYDKCHGYLAHLGDFLAVVPAAWFVSGGEQSDCEDDGLLDQELPRMVKQPLPLHSAVTQWKMARVKWCNAGGHKMGLKKAGTHKTCQENAM
jgi:hypothetical protein